MAETRALREVATIVRSKNAGPFRITFDVIFPDDATYRAACRSGALSPERVAERFGVDVADITHHVEFAAARAIKVTMRRPVSAGSPGDTDVYGCQQHVPLLDVRIPVDGPGAG